MAVCALIALPAAVHAQTWTKLKNTPSFSPGSEFLMTDGTIMVQDEGSGGRWRHLV